MALARNRELLLDAALVAAGGFAGAVSRALVASTFADGPVGITAVNVAGCGALGFLYGRESHHHMHLRPHPKHSVFFGIGYLGAFTTFSTFTTDCIDLAEAGRGGAAAAYFAANNVGGIGAAALALKIARRARP